MSSNQNIPILNRTLRVLEAVTERGSASAKQLSIDLGIPLATCYRILNTLAEARWLRRDAVGDYQLSFGIARLGGLASGMARFFAQAHAPIIQLAQQTACSVKISVAEGDEWMILMRHERPSPEDVFLQAGSRDCVVVGSVGGVLCRDRTEREIRQLIAENPSATVNAVAPEVIIQRMRCCRERGYSTDFGETNSVIHAVSVPLNLTPLADNAALTLSSPAEHLPEARLQEWVTQLCATAKTIETELS